MVNNISQNIYQSTKVIINDQLAMIDLAKKIADDHSIKIIALYGSLGVGKSFFAKHFINYLQVDKQEILSPTFNIVYSYPSIRGEIFHLDLYRLKNSLELENIDFFSMINHHLCLIEWPNIAEEFLSDNYLAIEIKNLSNNHFDQQREVILNHVKKI
jgi:tRNA threonylcarbamoyladenosine biosynthesis protein TsaE